MAEAMGQEDAIALGHKATDQWCCVTGPEWLTLFDTVAREAGWVYDPQAACTCNRPQYGHNPRCGYVR